MKLTIKEAWVEHYWVYSDTPSGVFIVSDVYHFCINTKKEDLNGFEKDWSIGIDFDKNMRGSSEESLIGDFDSLPGDTLHYFVQKGESLRKGRDITILGEMVLVKK